MYPVLITGDTLCKLCVVCEFAQDATGCIYGIVDVVNGDEKEEWSQYAPLRDTTGYSSGPFEELPVEDHLLSSRQPVTYPGKEGARNAHALAFRQEPLHWNFVKGLGKIEVYNINW